MKLIITLFAIIASSISNAQDAGAKLIPKAEKFLETLQKEVNIEELIITRNASYSPAIARSTKSPVADIGDKDQKWVAWKKSGGTKEAFITEVVEGKCAQVIQLLRARMSYITEVFVMDRLGANICAHPATSDYDQGDEDKWIEPFTNNKSPHVGSVETDESTGETQGQVSLSIKKDGKNIGTITIGIKSK